MIMPFIDEGRAGDGNDLISMMWRDGPSLLDRWNANDVLVNVRIMFFATHAIANAFHVLLAHADLAAALRTSEEQKVANFVEEVLRLFGPAQFRTRGRRRPLSCRARL